MVLDTKRRVGVALFVASTMVLALLVNVITTTSGKTELMMQPGYMPYRYALALEAAQASIGGGKPHYSEKILPTFALAVFI